MKQYRLSRSNMPVRPGWGLCVVWLFLLTKEICNVPIWVEVPFWVFMSFWLIGFFSLLKDSVEVDIFEKWNKK